MAELMLTKPEDKNTSASFFPMMWSTRSPAKSLISTRMKITKCFTSVNDRPKLQVYKFTHKSPAPGQQQQQQQVHYVMSQLIRVGLYVFHSGPNTIKKTFLSCIIENESLNWADLNPACVKAH